jgi:hypothetical protein
MGRQEREWAKWTDQERDRFLGGASAPAPLRRGVRSRRNELTLLAMLVSVAASLGCWQLHLFSFPVAAPHRAATPPAAVVYGAGHAHDGSTDMTCTAMVSDASGGESCTVWTILLPGQQAVQALRLPVGRTCPAVIADQHTGHWVCTTAVTT